MIKKLLGFFECKSTELLIKHLKEILESEHKVSSLDTFTRIAICIAAEGMRLKLKTTKLHELIIKVLGERQIIHFVSRNGWHAYNVQESTW